MDLIKSVEYRFEKWTDHQKKIFAMLSTAENHVPVCVKDMIDICDTVDNIIGSMTTSYTKFNEGRMPLKYVDKPNCSLAVVDLVFCDRMAYVKAVCTRQLDESFIDIIMMVESEDGGITISTPITREHLETQYLQVQIPSTIHLIFIEEIEKYADISVKSTVHVGK